MDDDFQCGNDIRLILWWLHNHTGDPRFVDTIANLTNVMQGVAQVLVASELNNQELGREYRHEGARLLVASSNRLAAEQMVTAGV